MTRVILHIDRLVLRGFDAQDRDGIVAGLRDQLERHFADPVNGASLASQPNVPKLDGGRVNVASGGDPSQTGSAVGDAVARGITR